METIEITKNEARELYKSASKELKQKLEGKFGKDILCLKITDTIKTFEDACQELGVSKSIISDTDSVDEIAYKKLKIIAKALNEGWQPDWNNSNECKYYPYFNMGSSGFGFSITYSDNWNTLTYVGSRLCFQNRELAEYAGRQFTEIYKDFLT